jgi:hypothetical protein
MKPPRKDEPSDSHDLTGSGQGQGGKPLPPEKTAVRARKERQATERDRQAPDETASAEREQGTPRRRRRAKDEGEGEARDRRERGERETIADGEEAPDRGSMEERERKRRKERALAEREAVERRRLDDSILSRRPGKVPDGLLVDGKLDIGKLRPQGPRPFRPNLDVDGAIPNGEWLNLLNRGLRSGIGSDKGKPDNDVVANLDSDVPLTLLPIRLETVFSGKHLRVRIFPDDIHVQDHDPELTADELQAGQTFWRKIEQAAGDDAALAAAQSWLIELLSEERALFVAEAALHADAPKTADRGQHVATLGCLPVFWRAIAYRRTSSGILEEIARKDGAVIPDALCFDLLHGETEDPAAPPARNAAWLHDFDLARDFGMALEIDLSGYADLGDKGLALLLVYGVGPGASRNEANRLRDLFEAHRFGQGAAFQAQGVPTNLVAGSTGGLSSDPAAAHGGLATLVDIALEAGSKGKPRLPAGAPALEPVSNALRIGRILGQGGAGPFAFWPGADRDEVDAPRWMNEALWPVTWGAYLDDFMTGEDGTTYIPEDAYRRMHQMWRDDVRGGGPLPALRIGRQPYGILPVRAHKVPEAWVDASPWTEYFLMCLRDMALAATPLVPKLSPGGGGQGRDEHLATVIEVLGAVPHPIRMLARDLRDWRTQTPDDPEWLVLAAFGMLWLAGTDPTYGHDSRSIMGQWGWAKSVLTNVDGTDFGAGLPRALVDAVEGPSVQNGDDQIVVLEQIRALLPAYLGSGESSKSAEAWIDYMIRLVQSHASRLEPILSQLGPLPLRNSMSAMLSPESDDPRIGWYRYSEKAREVTQPLVEDPGEDSAPIRPDQYLIAARNRVEPDKGSKPYLDLLDQDLSLRPMGGPAQGIRPGAVQHVTRGDAVRKTTLRGRTAAARLSIPAAGVTQPSTATRGLFTSGQFAPRDGLAPGTRNGPGDENPIGRGEGPLLKQLVDAAAARVPNGQRNGFRMAMERLAELPADTLAWSMRETLGLASNRLDAWLTALATRRMAEIEPSERAQIGGWGFVLDLKPDPKGSVPSTGFIHAPTMQQASTAGILRSGWENHGHTSVASPLAINLTSARLRAADRLIQSVGQGLRLGAILGQDFERALHDADLDRHLDAMRRGVLAATDKPDVVRGPLDGLDLIDADRNGKLAATLDAVRPASDRIGVEAAIAAVRAQFDALGDAGLAEATHFLAQGNTARAAAVLDAISLGEAPPSELRHARTDVAHAEVVHTICLALPSPEQTGTGSAGRASHSPALNAYVERNLPPINNVSLDVVSGETVTPVALNALGLDPLDLVIEGARPGVLGARAMLHLARQGAKLSPDARVPSSLTQGNARTDTIAPDLEDFEEFCSAFAAHLGALRPQFPAELGLPEIDQEAHVDRQLIVSRITGHKKTLQSLFDKLSDARRDRDLDLVLATLDVASRFSLPELLPGPDLLARRHAPEFWRDLRPALDILTARIAALEEITEDQPTDQLIKRLRVLSSGSLPPELVWHGLGAAPLAADLGFAQPAADALAEWLAIYAHVHDDVERFTRARDTRALLAGPPTPAMTVRQHTLVPPSGWLGHTLPEDGETGGAAWVVADAGGLKLLARGEAFVGYVVDSWTERLPGRSVKTGVAIQHDAPSSRPPQAILLAVTPDNMTPWSDALLTQTLIETIENAQVRAVTPSMIEGLGHHLPAVFVPGGVDAGPQPPTPAEED